MKTWMGDRRVSLGLVGTCAVAACLVGAARTAAQDPNTPPQPVPPGVQVLFDGKDLHNWVKRGDGKPAEWKVEDGAMIARGGDIMTKDKFQDYQLHVEFMTPYMPDAHGQARGNSGVYMQSRYEIQVLDSYGKARPGKGDCGAVYNQSAPLVNACKPALRWQTYDIVYRAPRFVDGKLTEHPRVTVMQNGVLIQNNTEIGGNTVSSVMGDDPATPGPILLQDHGNTVKYRNIWIMPLPEKGSDTYE
jgi:hypothetical protein